MQLNVEFQIATLR